MRPSSSTNKVALVVHGSFRFYGGGELLCMCTCRALQELGYSVTIVSDRFKPGEIEAAYAMGRVMRKCTFIRIPTFEPSRTKLLSTPQALYFAQRIRHFLESQSADIMFVTQDPPWPTVFPRRAMFRFIYHLGQLQPFWREYRAGARLLWQTFFASNYSQTALLALSPTVMSDLKRNGFPKSELVYPCYGEGFQPRTKKNQVVQVTFLAPQKRLEDFFEIARQLPQYRFHLVGRDTGMMDRIYSGYASRLLANKPCNVEYLEAKIRQSPWLLEESKIYLHTGTEPGMGIAVMEAMSAGCIPIVPRRGGAGDVLEVADAGYRYDTVEDAVRLIRREMEDRSQTDVTKSIPASPEETRARAQIYSIQAYTVRIGNLIEAVASSTNLGCAR